MAYLRKSQDRGHVSISWLDSKHTFSFGDYYAPEHRGFKTLRVINQDVVAGGGGFAPHPHKDMEIVTYMLDGALRHKDSTGEEGVIRPGDVQMMSAGRGIVHSEFNASDSEAAHLLQIWIHPKERGVEPRYQQQNFSEEMDRGGWVKIVAPEMVADAGEKALRIRQDLTLYARKFAAGENLDMDLGEAHGAWLQVVSGEVRWDDGVLGAGDGLGIDASGLLKLHANSKGEMLLFVFQ